MLRMGVVPRHTRPLESRSKVKVRRQESRELAQEHPARKVRVRMDIKPVPLLEWSVHDSQTTCVGPDGVAPLPSLRVVRSVRFGQLGWYRGVSIC